MLYAQYCFFLPVEFFPGASDDESQRQLFRAQVCNDRSTPFQLLLLDRNRKAISRSLYGFPRERSPPPEATWSNNAGTLLSH